MKRIKKTGKQRTRNRFYRRTVKHKVSARQWHFILFFDRHMCAYTTCTMYIALTLHTMYARQRLKRVTFTIIILGSPLLCLYTYHGRITGATGPISRSKWIGLTVNKPRMLKMRPRTLIHTYLYRARFGVGSPSGWAAFPGGSPLPLRLQPWK